VISPKDFHAEVRVGRNDLTTEDHFGLEISGIRRGRVVVIADHLLGIPGERPILPLIAPPRGETHPLPVRSVSALTRYRLAAERPKAASHRGATKGMRVVSDLGVGYEVGTRR
jgi:hypothetical protein